MINKGTKRLIAISLLGTAIVVCVMAKGNKSHNKYVWIVVPETEYKHRYLVYDTGEWSDWSAPSREMPDSSGLREVEVETSYVLKYLPKKEAAREIVELRAKFGSSTDSDTLSLVNQTLNQNIEQAKTLQKQMND